MLAHQIVGDEIADPLIERGRALEVGEQERQAGDLEPLIDIEGVGAIDVAEGLVGQEPLRGEERPAVPEQMVQLIAGDPQGRQHAAVGAVFERQPQRSGPHFEGCRPAHRPC